jgi:hypothetical protein
MLWQYLNHKLIFIPQIGRLRRYKYSPCDFRPTERIFRGFRLSDVENGSEEIKANSIRFPDFSCNWERFSRPKDVKKRAGGLKTDGCYSFRIETSRYNKMATTCHDPNPIEDPKNYAHVEVRQLLPTENVFDEPPKKRELKKEKEGWSPSLKLQYRQNIVFNLTIEIAPIA